MSVQEMAKRLQVRRRMWMASEAFHRWHAAIAEIEEERRIDERYKRAAAIIAGIVSGLIIDLVLARRGIL
jgi:hypothetical protein